MIKTSCVASVIVMALVEVVSPPAQGQSYPTKPIRIVVGFPPGGPNDVAARMIGTYLTNSLGQSVIVDNKPGASGNIGANFVAKASSDGYTILMANSTISTPSLFTNLPFDVNNDFVPIALVQITPEILAVHPSVPVNSVKDLIALAKAKPNDIRYGSSGYGNVDHLIVELFNTMAGTKMVHVPYKGASPLLVGLVSAEVQLTMTAIQSTLPYMETGKIRGIAVTTARRAAVLPNVPTIAEAGIPGFDASSWSGLLAPAGTPANIIGVLSKDVQKILSVAEIKERFATLGVEPARIATSEDFEKFLQDELRKWSKVIKAAGLKPQ